jgi:hypothetical protein
MTEPFQKRHHVATCELRSIQPYLLPEAKDLALLLVRRPSTTPTGYAIRGREAREQAATPNGNVYTGRPPVCLRVWICSVIQLSVTSSNLLLSGPI